MKLAVLACAFACLGWSQQNNTLVERVGTTGFLQLEAASFHDASPQQQRLAYWLTQASIAINPIIYDQMSRFGLRQKHMLETIVAHPDGVDKASFDKILGFTKLFWANRGNHHEITAQKIMPDFTFEELRDAGLAALRHGARGSYTETAFLKEIEELKPSLFDPKFEPMTTAKSPRGGLDVIQASSNNFYSGVMVADLTNFTERFPLNSRLVKINGRLEEPVYRAGTPDHKSPPGLYAQYLARPNSYLEKAAQLAEPPQARTIRDLIRYYP